MHNIFVKIHVWSSAVFTIIAILLVFSSIRGLLLKKEYSKRNVLYEYIYIGLLYFGLVMGIILYFFVDGSTETGKRTIVELQKEQSSRFWAIEHFSVMIFALLIAQIGKLFTMKAINSQQKFKYALFYYGTASCVVLISMIFYMYHKMQ